MSAAVPRSDRSTTAAPLDGRTAVVTGGSRGIGFHVAQQLAGAGARVAVTGRDAATIAAAAGRLGPGCRAFVCDQRDPAAVDRMAREVLDAQGAPDVLVANAGRWTNGAVKDLDPAQWDDVLATNLTGTFRVVRAFLPAMIERQRGDIFVIGSTSGKRGDANASAYAASKFGLVGFCECLRREVRTANLRVTLLNPSSTDTGDERGPREGKGVRMHAADLGRLIVALACLPGRALVPEMEIWGTNP